MNKILEDILFNKIESIKIAKNKCSFSTLEKLLPKKNNRKFKKKIIDSQNLKKNNIIAEIKKTSPSAGNIIKNYFPEKIAIEYEKSRVGAISILTDEKFFDGQIDHLSTVSKFTNIPILRKDFIIDKYQIIESKIFNADAILLILSILSDEQVIEFIDLSEKIGLDCIVEVHNIKELNRAIKIGYPIIGINNRNLDDLNIDTNNTLDLMKDIPNQFSIIAESGIKDKDDIIKYNKAGIFNFLIGETLLKSKNIKNKIDELLL